MMGMYDYIQCKYQLPDPEVQKHDFQTKDFENLLEYYTITASGTIIHHPTQWETVPEEERPYYGKPEWDKNPLYQTMGSIKTVPLDTQVLDLHGIIFFYTLRGDEWYEYKAKFTDGLLVNIERVRKEDKVFID